MGFRLGERQGTRAPRNEGRFLEHNTYDALSSEVPRMAALSPPETLIKRPEQTLCPKDALLSSDGFCRLWPWLPVHVTRGLGLRGGCYWWRCCHLSDPCGWTSRQGCQAFPASNIGQAVEVAMSLPASPHYCKLGSRSCRPHLEAQGCAKLGLFGTNGHLTPSSFRGFNASWCAWRRSKASHTLALAQPAKLDLGTWNLLSCLLCHLRLPRWDNARTVTASHVYLILFPHVVVAFASSKSKLPS